MLTDALYLDADWASPFPPSQTRPGPFTTASGRQVSAEFLHGGAFRIGQRGRVDRRVAALPRRQAGDDRAAARLRLRRLPGAVGGDPERHHRGAGDAGRRPGGGLTDIALPKVSLRSSASLGNLLASLGMGVAFNSERRLHRPVAEACCIGLVVHAATLAVAEKGTVASAATAVGITPTAVSVPLAGSCSTGPTCCW